MSPATPILGGKRGGHLPAEGYEADGAVLTAGLATLLTIPAKPDMLANELTMLSKLAAPGTGVLEGPEFNVAADGLATMLAVPAKLGMWAAMLLAIMSMEGGAVGTEGVGEGVEPPMVAATPANEGMLVVIMSATSARVG